GRRHTRVSRDWSSDVCSSDLPTTASKRSKTRWNIASSAAWYSSVQGPPSTPCPVVGREAQSLGGPQLAEPADSAMPTITLSARKARKRGVEGTGVEPGGGRGA